MPLPVPPVFPLLHLPLPDVMLGLPTRTCMPLLSHAAHLSSALAPFLSQGSVRAIAGIPATIRVQVPLSCSYAGCLLPLILACHAGWGSAFNVCDGGRLDICFGASPPLPPPDSTHHASCLGLSTSFHGTQISLSCLMPRALYVLPWHSNQFCSRSWLVLTYCEGIHMA